jgi:hypothetical protein
LHCSFDSCKKEYALCDAVGAVYGSQGFKAEEAGEKAAAAVEESGEEESGSDIKPAAKKQRRHSGGSSGATAQASQTFAQVMSAFMPPAAPPKLTSAEWFGKVMATDEQVAAIKERMPASTSAPSTLLLSVLDEEELKECGLNKIQIAAWKKLARAESI